MKKFILAAAAGLAASAMLSAPATAAAIVVADPLTCISVANSNGCLFNGNLGNAADAAETQAVYNSYNDTHASAQPDIVLNFLFKSDSGAGFFGSLTGFPGTSGTWSTPGYKIDFLGVKASNSFTLYKLSGVSSGSWNTFTITNKKGVPHGLSHLTFFGTRDGGGGLGVPEPGTWALMIMGFGSAGAMLRRRRTLVA